jgi:hypothetical protein
MDNYRITLTAEAGAKLGHLVSFGKGEARSSWGPASGSPARCCGMRPQYGGCP